jgi:transcriptional regulator with XRE-family HTH domain
MVDPSSSSASVLTGLGPALRWLRERQAKKQYNVADAAGITKGMLSAYETGRQRPSIETLDKILSTLGCTLVELHNAIQVINGRPDAMWRRAEPADLGAEPGEGVDVRGLLGLSAPVAAEVERSFSQMLSGFHRFLRYLEAKVH